MNIIAMMLYFLRYVSLCVCILFCLLGDDEVNVLITYVSYNVLPLLRLETL